MRTMRESVRKKWDEAADAWVDFVRTGKDYYRDELNNPAMFELLGDVSGKKILDVACGEGYNTRIMAEKGAHVTGIDFSEKLVEFAIQKEREETQGIQYYVGDVCDLNVFENCTFDIVTCFMALQDIENYQSAIKEAGRVLKDKGRFVFVIPHPCFEKRVINGDVIGGWEYGEKRESEEKAKDKTPSETTSNPLYYKVDRYFDTHSYTISWKMERLSQHFVTTSFHRTLTDYVNALYEAGFLISRLKEPKPTERGLKIYPMGNILRIPQSIVIEAVKC